MTDAETRRMAESKAIAGLCPITEANLGDGTFEAVRFSRGGGKFGVGSDSNVLIGLPDELRQLEYSQRLAHRSRNVLAAAGQSTARALFDGALEGGSIALAIGAGIAAGQPANFLSLRVPDGDLTDDAVLDSWLFANGTKPDSVWVAGRKLVEGGRHHRRDEISARFRSVMHQLLL